MSDYMNSMSYQVEGVTLVHKGFFCMDVPTLAQAQDIVAKLDGVMVEGWPLRSQIVRKPLTLRNCDDADETRLPAVVSSTGALQQIPGVSHHAFLVL